VVPSNVVVWKNIHSGFGYVDGIGNKNNILVNIPPEPGKLQAILKEKRFNLKGYALDSSGMILTCRN
jgi:hypothetical protein